MGVFHIISSSFDFFLDDLHLIQISDPHSNLYLTENQYCSNWCFWDNSLDVTNCFLVDISSFSQPSLGVVLIESLINFQDLLLKIIRSFNQSTCIISFCSPTSGFWFLCNSIDLKLIIKVRIL